MTLANGKTFDGETFQSPLGEVVKETFYLLVGQGYNTVFQSPLGEVVKETGNERFRLDRYNVSIPSRGSGKGDLSLHLILTLVQQQSFNPLSGKW